MPITVLTTRPLPLPEISLGDEAIIWCPLDQATVDAGPSILLSTSLDWIDAKVIDDLPETVRLIANLGIGVDHIDLAAAEARGLKVSNTPVVTEDTADLTFALILSACRRIGQSERYVRSGHWSNKAPMTAMGKRVHGQALGLIGFGNIGQAVARRARGFDMEVLYWNRSAKPDAEKATGARRVESLVELVGTSDIVSLHTPLTPETTHILYAHLLGHFKPGAVLINTGRGSLVDEAALARALKNGSLASAGLDVFENEPAIHPELLELESVVLTPHIGSATEACRRDIVARGLANIDKFLKTGTPVDPVV